MKYDVPHFVIKNNLQKSKKTNIYFSAYVTVDVLKDVCKRITGLDYFTYQYVDNDYKDDFLPATYNKGRIAILKYIDEVMFISFSEKDIHSRNSSVQSVPTAFNMYYLNRYFRKKLFYYFLSVDGNPETDYHILMYRLMKTSGFNFLNLDVLQHKIEAFTSIEDIMYNRKINSGKNKSNNSTYITKSTVKNIDVYGKTYGANKYETSMICYAISILARKEQSITLYEVLEKDLKELPNTSLHVIRDMGKIKIVPTDIQLEKKEFEKNNSFRSPRYQYNLFNKLGKKRCVMCDCEIPEIIQGAHIWSVATIKKQGYMSFDDKIKHATSGDNGLWLCENHHRLFDQNIIFISQKGEILFNSLLNNKNEEFLNKITTHKQLPEYIMTDDFLKYLNLRNSANIINCEYK